MASDNKDTIYIDIDDEITGIIDKVRNSSNKVVALVLPKRASVFQSIVNMKLLKRAADSSKKNLVLITSEAGLLPLAGAAGIHVAKTLASRPEIPSAPQTFVDTDEAVGEDEQIPLEDDAAAIDQSAPVGALAGGAAGAKAADDLETVTLNNDEPTEEEAAAGAATAAAAAEGAKAAAKGAVKKDKSLKVPNFERFRLILGIIILAIILGIIAFFFISASLAKATITIATNSTAVDANLNLNLDTTAKELDPTTNTIPAKYDQEQKTFSQQVGTTGQKNEGNKATGTVDMTAQYCSNTAPGSGPSNVPAGTGVSVNGNTYITQSDTSFSGFPQYNFQTRCYTVKADSSTPITAQSGGSAYNVSGVTFSVAGSYSGYTMTANGSASGGTDNMVQVVNQNDINNAKSKIGAGNDNSIKQALTSQLQGEGYFPIGATFTTGTPNIQTSANVGDAASTVTVTETITYAMFGVHRSDLKTLVDNSVDSQIDTTKQSIQNDGIDTATFTTNGNNLQPNGGQVSMSTHAVAGPSLDIASIRENSAGKKAGDIKGLIMNDPNVTGVSIKFSPFWASTAPKDASKIKVIIAQPTTTKTSK